MYEDVDGDLALSVSSPAAPRDNPAEEVPLWRDVDMAFVI